MSNAMQNIVVVGDGGWGTALALCALAAGRRAALWSYDAEYAALMRDSRTNPRYLPGFPLPESLSIHHDMASAASDADLLVSAVPTAFLRATWSRLAEHVPAGTPVVSVSKGLERETLLRPTQILAEVLGREEDSVAVLSGPNIAGEVAAGLPAATVVSSGDADLSAKIQTAFSGESFRVYSNPDPIGVELGGVLKNVVALAAGICDGAQAWRQRQGGPRLARLVGDGAPWRCLGRTPRDVLRPCRAGRPDDDVLLDLKSQPHLRRAPRARRTRRGHFGQHAAGGGGCEECRDR